MHFPSSAKLAMVFLLQIQQVLHLNWLSRIEKQINCAELA